MLRSGIPAGLRRAPLAAVLALVVTGSAAALPLVGVTADGLGGTLYDVDATTGALSNPRAVVGGLGGLTWLDTGQLVATRHHVSGFGLHEIDPLTGADTLLVTFPSSVIEGGVAQDPGAGTIYAVNMDPGGGAIPGLFSIDVGAGTTTFIGSVFDTDGSGTSMDLSALSFDTFGRLWAVRDIGALELVQIDPATGDVLSYLPIGGGLPVSLGLAGLALDEATGRFFFSYGSFLYDLDPNTGATTLIGATGSEQLAGLAYRSSGGQLPGPSLAPLLLIAGAAVVRRRAPAAPWAAR